MVRVIQIITLALCSGLGSFGVVTLVINNFEIDWQPNSAGLFGIGVAGAIVVLHLVVPRLILKGALQKTRADILDLSGHEQFVTLIPAFQTSHIIACALLEGAGFFNGFLYMTQDWGGNIVAVVVLLFLIIMRFPTPGTLKAWVRHRLDEISLRR